MVLLFSSIDSLQSVAYRLSSFSSGPDHPGASTGKNPAVFINLLLKSSAISFFLSFEISSQRSSIRLSPSYVTKKILSFTFSPPIFKCIVPGLGLCKNHILPYLSSSPSKKYSIGTPK